MNYYTISSSANFNKYINQCYLQKTGQTLVCFSTRLRAHLDSNFINDVVTRISKNAIILLFS